MSCSSLSEGMSTSGDGGGRVLLEDIVNVIIARHTASSTRDTLFLWVSLFRAFSKRIKGSDRSSNPALLITTFSVTSLKNKGDK